MQTIYFGGGCFWCIEAIFKQLKGVSLVLPGYAGGSMLSPTYAKVSTGDTGHAEVIQITYDDQIISLSDLLSVFFSVHDPTTLNRQEHDVGTQYRSLILFTTSKQAQIIQTFIQKLSIDKIYSQPIVTEIKPLEKFYEAEEYHHDYFAKHHEQTYCQLVINPKLKKFKEKWSVLIK